MTIHETATNILSLLAPLCERCEIAGSIRRGKAEPKDIEIVCVPNSITAGLFGSEMQRDPYFIDQVQAWEKKKGDPQGKYTQRIVDGHVLDLFMVDAEAFGLQMLIRTGPAEFSQAILGKFNNRGFRSEGGFLYQPDDLKAPRFSFREEADVFAYLGIPYIAPSERNAEALWR